MQTLYEIQERKIKEINCVDQGRSPVRFKREVSEVVASGYI